MSFLIQESLYMWTVFACRQSFAPDVLIPIGLGWAHTRSFLTLILLPRCQFWQANLDWRRDTRKVSHVYVQGKSPRCWRTRFHCEHTHNTKPPRSPTQQLGGIWAGSGITRFTRTVFHSHAVVCSLCGSGRTKKLCNCQRSYWKIVKTSLAV